MIKHCDKQTKASFIRFPVVSSVGRKDPARLPIRGGSFAAVEDWEDCPLIQANGQ